MSQDPNYEHQLRLYAAYVAERVEADRFKLEIGGRSERLQSLIAGGALAVSVTFLEKIAPIPICGSRWLALVGWCALGTSLLASLYAASEGQNAIGWKIDNLDEIQRRQVSGDTAAPADASENPFIARVRRANTVSRYCTAAGLLCLILFAFLNLPVPPEKNEHIQNTEFARPSAAPNPNQRELIRNDSKAGPTAPASIARTDGPDELLRANGQSGSASGSAIQQGKITMANPAPNPSSTGSTQQQTQESRGSYIPTKNQVPPPPPPPVTPKDK